MSSLSVVGSFFKEIHPTFYSPARSEKQLSELILSYTGDIEKPQLIYNPVMLKKAYAKCNELDPFKSKPLSVISMDSPAARKTLQITLKAWSKTAKEESRKYDALYTVCDNGTSPEKRCELHFQWMFFDYLKSLIGNYIRKELRMDFVSAAIDTEGRIQAISLSYPDEKNAHAWYVEALLTAPHNSLQSTHPLRVKGAGSALIEDAILKSIRRQGLNTKDTLAFEAMKNTAVVLHANSSLPFYLKLFFANDFSRKPSRKILKGENLFHFLKEYGGRAQLEH
jgi:hypothetical protein